jgi:hypothetical protein
MPRGGKRAIDDVARGVVAAHGVNGDPDHVALFFFDGPRLAASIVAAVRTDAVRRFGLVAMRTLAEADGLEGIVGATLRRPCLRVSSFWIRHRSLSVFSLMTVLLQRLQRRKPGIVPPALAIARRTIEVRSTHDAQPLAVRPAQGLHR